MEIWETVLVNMKCDGVSEDDIVKKKVNIWCSHLKLKYNLVTLIISLILHLIMFTTWRSTIASVD